MYKSLSREVNQHGQSVFTITKVIKMFKHNHIPDNRCVRSLLNCKCSVCLMLTNDSDNTSLFSL